MIRVFILVVLASIIQPTYGQLDFSEGKRVSSPLLDEMVSKIENGDYENITSVLIAKEGELVFERYFNGASQNTQHNTRSSTKTIATLLTGIAITKGYIKSEKDLIFEYLKPRNPIKNSDVRKEKTTIEDLLTMSSIFECDDNNYFSRGNEERMYIVEDWLQFFLDLPVRSYPFGPKPEESPYGRVMSYCSAGAAAVAEVVQSAVGQSLDEFIQNELFEPLDIKDYELHHTPFGLLNTAGGSEYRSRDLLKMIKLLAQNGTWNGQKIIEEEWVKKATSVKVNAWEGVDYGYLLWMKPFGKDKKYDAYYMSGNGGQKVLSLREKEVTVVITTTNYGNRKAHGYTDELMNDFIVPSLD
ncbi:MAG: serine hydrolase [Bacteroidota bacterium]